jgi:hypothetical protein
MGSSRDRRTIIMKTVKEVSKLTGGAFLEGLVLLEGECL